MNGLDLPHSVERDMLAASIQRLLADNPRPGWRDLADGIGLAGLTVPEAGRNFAWRTTDGSSGSSLLSWAYTRSQMASTSPTK